MEAKLLVGEMVEVLSKAEIIATLDERGELDGLPFMPEMLQHCGKQFRVAKRAHKTCDFVTHTGIRRLERAVHLANLRCDGSAHGGCEAACMLFWKEDWLKRIEQAGDVHFTRDVARTPPANPSSSNCTEAKLDAVCSAPGSASNSIVYTCQATRLPAFTTRASGWDIRLYVEDYRSGNVPSLSYMIPRFLYRGYDNLINLGIGIGPFLRWLYDRFQGLRGGIPYPARSGRIKLGSPTPTGTLDLQPGDIVRVKGYREILESLDTATKNRGMAFSAEMVPYCGKTFRVKSRVTRLVDEKTGKMLHMKSPCIILDGVACSARYNKSMLFCPRATYSYWREIWLERVSPEEETLVMESCPARAEAESCAMTH
jgi:hypothetical protein